jgi:selenocysteine lyase/cysteine desulfurase
LVAVEGRGLAPVASVGAALLTFGLVMRRKAFLSLVPGLVAASCAHPRTHEGSAAPLLPEGRPRGPDDEAWWGEIGAQYDPQGFVNLENGYFTRAARPVMAAHTAHRDEINRRGAHYMRVDLQPRLEAARIRVAAFAGVPAEEVALLRNATEAMNVVLQGLPWEPGDEIVLSDQDYDSMVGILRTLARRRGVVLRQAALPEQPGSDAEVIDAYLRHVGPRTRLALVTQVIHLTGQLLPVGPLARALRDRGVKVLVDGAHALAQLPFSVAELEADFFGASLHKWLGAPLGNGMLWMRAAEIERVEPLFADVDRPPGDIRRFEHVGTRPAHDFEAIADAIDFHERIGGQAKRERLLWLRQRWVRAVADAPGIRLRSPLDDARACAIATVAVEGRSPPELQRALWERGLYTVALEHPVIQGVRVTVHPANAVGDVDRLVEALHALA